VAALAAKNPAITAAEVAAKLGIGERTARRHLTGK
jgi:predicted ArsR family transcriptional regulator